MFVFARAYFNPIAVAAALALAPPALAATLTFNTDDAVFIVRTFDQDGTAVTEFIGDPGEAYQCIAMDLQGAPLAISTALADIGLVTFENVEADDIFSVGCRKR